MVEYAVMPYSDYKTACDAVRAKGAGSASIKSAELGPAISSIQTGGSIDWTPGVVKHGSDSSFKLVNDGSYPAELVEWLKSEQKLTRTYLLEAYCAVTATPSFYSFPPYTLIANQFTYSGQGWALWTGWGTATSVWGIGDTMCVKNSGQVMWVATILENVRTYNRASQTLFSTASSKVLTLSGSYSGGVFFIRCGGLYDHLKVDAQGGYGVWNDANLQNTDGSTVHVATRHQWCDVNDRLSLTVTTDDVNACVAISDRLFI